jgi:hypothetical protein
LSSSLPSPLPPEPPRAGRVSLALLEELIIGLPQAGSATGGLPHDNGSGQNDSTWALTHEGAHIVARAPLRTLLVWCGPESFNTTMRQLATTAGFIPEHCHEFS